MNVANIQLIGQLIQLALSQNYIVTLKICTCITTLHSTLNTHLKKLLQVHTNIIHKGAKHLLTIEWINTFIYLHIHYS